jgi:hypothetical protein
LVKAFRGLSPGRITPVRASAAGASLPLPEVGLPAFAGLRIVLEDLALKIQTLIPMIP